MKKNIILLFLFSFCLTSIKAQQIDKMDWFRDARFGMFVHWGIYSHIAGEWKGDNSHSAFVMLTARIPVKEYEEVAATFNPVRFDAEKWVLAAKKCGMKYIVYTAKHHEGFAMYHSRCSSFNIYDMTPFKRDPLKELELACRKYGIKLGIYYSLGKDWHDPDVPTNWPTKGGRSNTWDFPDEDAKDINRYLERKAKPQIMELLKQYNPDIIWFDTPELTPEHQSKAIRKMILDYNPDIIINDRIGNKLGDFATLEQKESGGIIPNNWEACITMSKYWEYNKKDDQLKSSEKLIGILVDMVSKGGNLLLNVGPTPEGVILKSNIARMDTIGRWMDINGEAIYSSKPWLTYGENADPGSYKKKRVAEAGLEDVVLDETRNVVQDIRFTTRNGYLYVIARGWEDPVVHVKTLTDTAYPAGSVTLLGHEGKLTWKQTGEGMSIDLPSDIHMDVPVYVFKVDLHSLGTDKQKKENALQEIRKFYAGKLEAYKSVAINKDSVRRYFTLLADNGGFSDLKSLEDDIEKNNYASQERKQSFISNVTKIALERLRIIAETYRNKEQSITDPKLRLLFRGISHYGKLENNRLNVPSRWHVSCFAAPRVTTNIYFSLFDLMTRIERGEIKDPLFIDAHKRLGDVSFQCWTVPARSDQTDSQVVSVDRFRKHVWWVGGNATGYRPLLQTAAQLSSCEMADVVAEVAVRSISSVSQTTIRDDFWQEGITADGAGWGHGMQCLVWGYPIHGTIGSLVILDVMKDYPLPINLKEEHISTLIDYLRGSSFYYYKGYIPPVVDRGNMNPLERPYPGRNGNKETDFRYGIPSSSIANMLLDKFPDKLTPAQKEELTLFQERSRLFRMDMPGKWQNYYSGSRYFFNNDDIIKKTGDYYLLINMASNRVSGLESAKTMAAAFNIFTCDGSTLFFRKGDEYQRVLGAFNLRTWAGITSRLSPEPLVPIENWSGYNSLHRFAAGATSGSNSFAGGFIFEKNNCAWQQNNKPFDPQLDPNPSAFGVKAYKGYFMFDDVFLAMGCGIENKMSELEGDIVTTLDQTGLKPDFKNGSLVRNNGFYYRVLNKYTTGKVVVKQGKKKTEWQRLCVENRLPETEENIFHMYIDHGRDVKDASYAYTVSCTDAASRETPVILSNTKDVQAAESHDGSRIGAVFYTTATEIKCSKGRLKVSAPCALLLEFTGNRVSLSVTDGVMDADLKEIRIDTSIPLKGEAVDKVSEGVYRLRVKTGSGRYTGAPVYMDYAYN